MHKQLLKRAASALTVQDVNKAKTSIEVTSVTYRVNIAPLTEFTHSQDSMHAKVSILNGGNLENTLESAYSPLSDDTSLTNLEPRLLALIEDIKTCTCINSEDRDIVNMTVNDIKGDCQALIKLLSHFDCSPPIESSEMNSDMVKRLSTKIKAQ